MWVFVPQVPYVLNDITDYQYSICDIGLLFQIYYYRITNPVHLVNTTSSSCRLRESETEDSEASPLLRRGHNRRESNPQWWRHGHVQVLLPYILGICFVLLVGGISYIVHTRGLYNDSPPVDTSTGRVFDWKSQLLGWISAALYSESNSDPENEICNTERFLFKLVLDSRKYVRCLFSVFPHL